MLNISYSSKEIKERFLGLWGNYPFFGCPQAITLDCPTALVWNCVGEGKSPSVLNGSPLDHLHCSPSTLPMPQRANNPAVR
jgi:hypothetical protein